MTNIIVRILTEDIHDVNFVLLKKGSFIFVERDAIDKISGVYDTCNIRLNNGSDEMIDMPKHTVKKITIKRKSI